MIPEGQDLIPGGQELGQGLRAVLAALAFGAAGLIIYLLFSSGWGRPPHTAMLTPRPVPATTLPPEPPPTPVARPSVPTSRPGDRPVAAGAGGPRRVAAPGHAIAVVSDGFWLTHLPKGLVRTRGGPLTPSGARARFTSPRGFVEAQVEHGSVAADWDGYRDRFTVLNARPTTVRGKPAVVGRHPGGGRTIVWLERSGTGAWIRVSDSLGGELLAIAASVKAPVGD